MKKLTKIVVMTATLFIIYRLWLPNPQTHRAIEKEYSVPNKINSRTDYNQARKFYLHEKEERISFAAKFLLASDEIQNLRERSEEANECIMKALDTNDHESNLFLSDDKSRIRFSNGGGCGYECFMEITYDEDGNPLKLRADAYWRGVD